MARRKRVNKYPKLGWTTTELKNSLRDLIPKNGYFIGARELFLKRMRVPKLRDGMFFYQLPLFKKTKPDIDYLYANFFYDMYERMVFDFINGYDVVYDKKRNLRFHKWDSTPSTGVIKKLTTYGMYGVPSFDIRKTGWKVPTVMMELGHKDKVGAVVILPSFMYSVFLDNIYNGVSHIKLDKPMSTPEHLWKKNADEAIEKGNAKAFFGKWSRVKKKK